MWFGTQEGLNRYDGYNFKVYMHQRDNLKSVSFNAQLDALEDRWGNIWFGTYSGGLERFDPGTGEFIHYKAGQGTRGRLSYNFIRALYEDSRGRLWIGTAGGGLNLMIPAGEPGKDNPAKVWDPKKVRFYSFFHDPKDPSSLSHNFVEDIVEDKDGNLWLGTRGGGLNRVTVPPEAGTWKNVNKTGKPGFKLKFEHFSHNPGDPGSPGSNDILSLCVDSSGTLWVGTKDAGLCRLLPGENGFTRYRHIPGDSRSISSDQVFDILEDSQGILWIGTYGGGLDALLPDRQAGKETPLTFLHHRHQVNNPNSIGNNIVMCLYQDRQDILWVGTDGGGISKFDRKKYQFPHYTSIPGNRNSLNNPSVRCIFQDASGIFWIGTDGGLNRFDPGTGNFFHFNQSSGRSAGKSAGKSTVKFTSISHNVVRTICQDRAGTLWLGTSGGGLNRLTIKNKRKNRGSGVRSSDFEFTHYRNIPGNVHSLSDDTILVVIPDGDKEKNGLWIGTHGGGLNYFDAETETFTHYRADLEKKGSISSDYIRSLYQDVKGTLWVGTDGKGLNRFDGDKKEFTVYIHDPDDISSLSSSYILTIYQSPSDPGTLWLGTLGGGLNKFDIASGTATHYREKDGLPNNVIYGILEESPGQALWMSTNKGLCRFDPRNMNIKTFTVSDGLQSMEFNGNAFFKSRTGEFFFGGINGFNSFLPSRISRNTHVPPIVLTEFNLFHRAVPLAAEVVNPGPGTRTLPVPLHNMKAISLTHTENFFSIEFSALDYTAPEKNKYRYMLEGVDKAWVQCGVDQRSAHYTNIEPGHYVFRVTGANNNDVWNHAGTSFKIIITPPFWKTWWFDMSVGVVVVWLLVFLLHKRISSVRKEARRERARMTREMEKRELEQELRLKADFTAMLVHELRNPLTAVMGYSELLMKAPKRANVHNTGSVIFKSTGRMLGIINDMLDISKFEAGKMVIHKKISSLNGVIEDNVQLVTPLLEEKGISVKYDLEELDEISMDREKITQVIHNFISNALKFSPVGGVIRFITRTVEVENRVYQELSIGDEGPGVPEESREHLFDKYAQLKTDVTIKGTGLGLAVSRLIIEAHNGYIGYTPAHKKGSIFYFRLPQ